MESLNDALIHRMKNFGLDPAVSAAQLLNAAKRVLPSTVHPKTFRNGILTVEIDTGIQSYLFRKEIDTYLEHLNAALGDKKITTIRIRTTHQI